MLLKYSISFHAYSYLCLFLSIRERGILISSTMSLGLSASPLILSIFLSCLLIEHRLRIVIFSPVECQLSTRKLSMRADFCIYFLHYFMSVLCAWLQKYLLPPWWFKCFSTKTTLKSTRGAFFFKIYLPVFNIVTQIFIWLVMTDCSIFHSFSFSV